MAHIACVGCFDDGGRVRRRSIRRRWRSTTGALFRRLFYQRPRLRYHKGVPLLGLFLALARGHSCE